MSRSGFKSLWRTNIEVADRAFSYLQIVDVLSETGLNQLIIHRS